MKSKKKIFLIGYKIFCVGVKLDVLEGNDKQYKMPGYD